MNLIQEHISVNNSLRQDEQTVCKLTKEGLHYFYPETGLNVLKRNVRLPFHTFGPEHVAIELTSKCQKRCPFCYASSTPYSKTLWTPAEVIKFCKNLIGKVFTINFGGGEPFEFEGITDVINSLKNENAAISVTTNGMLLDKYLPKIQPNPKLTITVSLHGPEEMNHVVYCVKLLKSKGFKTNVNVLLRQSKLEQLKELLPRLLALTKVTFLNFKPFGFGKLQKQEVLHPDEILDFVKSLGLDSTYIGSCVSVPEGIRTIYADCGAKERWVTVTSRKTVKPCSFSTEESSLNDLSYSGLIQALCLCNPPCLRKQKQSLTSPINVWYSNSSAHSMDTSFWAITDKSVARFWTGEDGVIPSWPELNETELFEEMLAEALKSKTTAEKLKQLVSESNIKKYWNYQILITDKPLTGNKTTLLLTLSYPDIKHHKYGCFINEERVVGLEKLKGVRCFKVDVNEVLERISFCYYAGCPEENYKKAYKKGYIDECGNEIIYFLSQKPAFNLKDIAPRLFRKITDNLAQIDPKKKISMADEDCEKYSEEPLDCLNK